MTDTEFKASELCSRKLWQLVNQPRGGSLGEIELREAIAELAARRHYLRELEDLGRLKP